MDQEDAVRQRIVELMARRRIASRNVLASQAGVNFNTLNNYLKRRSSSLRAGSLHLIAESLQVTAAVLRGDEPMPETAPPTVSVSLDIDGDIYDVFQAIAAVERQDVRDTITLHLTQHAASMQDDPRFKETRRAIAETRSGIEDEIELAVAQWKAEQQPGPSAASKT